MPRLFFQAGVEEGYETINGKIIATDRGKLVAFGVKKGIVRLGVYSEPCTGYVRVHTTDLLQGLAIRSGQPFRLIEFGLVIHIKSHKDIFIPENIQDSRIAPDALFHLAAVDAAVAGDVDEDGFALGLSGGEAFLQGELAGQTERHLEVVLLAVGGDTGH